MKLVQIKFTDDQHARLSALAATRLMTLTATCRAILGEALAEPGEAPAQPGEVAGAARGRPAAASGISSAAKTMANATSWDGVLAAADFETVETVPDDVYFKFFNEEGSPL